MQENSECLSQFPEPRVTSSVCLLCLSNSPKPPKHLININRIERKAANKNRKCLVLNDLCSN